MKVYLCGKFKHNNGMGRFDLSVRCCFTVQAMSLNDVAYWLETDDGSPVPLPPPVAPGQRAA